MTLCLSGAADRNHAVLSVFDRQITLADASGVIASHEAAIKGARINHGWALFFAGDDIRLVGIIMDSVKHELIRKRPVTLERARKTVLSVRDRVLNQTLSSEVLGRFGLDVDTFWREGTSRISDPQIYQSICDQLLQAKAGCDFLLAGFGARAKNAHLLAIMDGHGGHSFDREGFGAIGSGDADAFRVLATMNYSRDLSAYEAAFALCAAKFSAESALVGKGTHVSMFRLDGSMHTLDAEQVRPIVRKHGVKGIPPGIESEMPRFKQIVAPYRLIPVARSVQKSPKRDRKRQPPSRA